MVKRRVSARRLKRRKVVQHVEVVYIYPPSTTAHRQEILTFISFTSSQIHLCFSVRFQLWLFAFVYFARQINRGPKWNSIDLKKFLLAKYLRLTRVRRIHTTDRARQRCSDVENRVISQQQNLFSWFTNDALFYDSSASSLGSRAHREHIN